MDVCYWPCLYGCVLLAVCFMKFMAVCLLLFDVDMYHYKICMDLIAMQFYNGFVCDSYMRLLKLIIFQIACVFYTQFGMPFVRSSINMENTVMHLIANHLLDVIQVMQYCCCINNGVHD